MAEKGKKCHAVPVEATSLIPFTFEQHSVRVFLGEDKEPIFVAAIFCTVLGLSNVSKAVGRLESHEKGVTLSDTPGGVQSILTVTEPGLYRLIFRSDKPEAKRFQTWVFSEVLPAIRKTGQFTVQPADPVEKYPELRAIRELIIATAEARDEALLAREEARDANANAVRALETQLFFTVAEYIYINKLTAQLPESGYKACSDHLRLYCLDHRIPFRKQSVGGKRWPDEYAYHINVYTEVLPGWLTRRYAQATLHVIHPS